MTLRRLLLLTAVSMLLSNSALAQRPGPEFWRRVTCEPLEPRTKLEALEMKYETILIKGFTRITTVEISGVRIDAVEWRDTRNSARASGITISLTAPADRQSDRLRENRALIDYDEIEPLLNAIDTLSKMSETTTKLTGFEARYKTPGDLEMVVFRQTRSGNAVTLTAGICDKVTQVLTLDEFAKFRAMLAEARMRLDELK
ncbi:MAG TPA: hypothetical protein VF074_03350 [Pyrinomonadaceae bacterium]